MLSVDLGKICDGSAVPQINNKNIEPLPFPQCSTDEQIKISIEVENLFTVCKNVEVDIAESINKSHALQQSILKKAFEGKLLSEAEIEKCKQEHDYEPARVLLERIKAEKKK